MCVCVCVCMCVQSICMCMYMCLCVYMYMCVGMCELRTHCLGSGFFVGVVLIMAMYSSWQGMCK